MHSRYIAGRDAFTVNLALVTRGPRYWGIIGAPALGLNGGRGDPTAAG
jgi:3'-phosphoadenosine 5'-phosphosulfate (PAPS) 3'-phosphatase